MQNIKDFRLELKEICKNCGRDAGEITLVAVSKTKTLEQIKQGISAGQIDFGENYIQEAFEKSQQLKSQNINWHFIGNVQTNKVKYLAEFCTLLHSLDRISLAKALQKKLAEANKIMEVLIQINISGEKTKSGITPDELPDFAKQLSIFPNLKLTGLMAIAENTEDETAIRSNFKTMKQLFDQLKSHNPAIKHLSMGMSADYRIAIEEGATMLRIGSKIFGSRA